MLKKELIDALRDRRSLATALFFPLLGPVVVAALFSVLIDREAGPKTLELPVIGAERAPDLIDFLKRHEVTIQPGPTDADRSIRERTHDVVLEIDADYPKQFAEGRPAKLHLVYDASQNEASRSVRQTRALLRQYGSGLGALRLLARGVSPEVAAPVQVRERDLATPQRMAGNILNMVPIFIILAGFVGGMQVAIDATAGERERGSLEPLLINPVGRGVLALGKWLAAFALATVGVVLTAIACGVALSYVALAELGLRADLGAWPIFKLAVLTIPVAALATALQMVVATFARTYKEAQTYLSLLIFLPMTPGLWFTVNPASTKWWMMTVPMLSQTRLLGDVLSGIPLHLGQVAVSVSTTLAVAALLVFVGGRLLDSERIIFGQ